MSVLANILVDQFVSAAGVACILALFCCALGMVRRWLFAPPSLFFVNLVYYNSWRDYQYPVRDPSAAFLPAIARCVGFTVPFLLGWIACSWFSRWIVRQTLQARCNRGLCLDCGYDLRGNQSGVCPECGRKLDPAVAPDNTITTYCEIYVDFPGSIADLEEWLRHEFAQGDPRCADALSVMRNKRLENAAASADAPWLDYPYYVECEPPPESYTTAECAELVTAIVRALKTAGHDAVPACDYENLLPADVAWKSSSV